MPLNRALVGADDSVDVLYGVPSALMMALPEAVRETHPADLLQMAHFLSILGPMGCIMHQVLLSLQLLPLALGILLMLLLVLKREHLLRLVFVLLHLLLVQDLLLLLISESLLFLVAVHVSVDIVLLRGFLESRSVVIFAHVVISLSKSI